MIYQGLLLSYGDAKRVWSMDKVSNSRITQEEYDKWIKIMETCKLHIMTYSVYNNYLIGSSSKSKIYYSYY